MKDINLVINPDDYLVLVNKHNKLSSTYIPSELELINELYSDSKQYLRKKARSAFESMTNDAKKIGLNIIAVSTYRSYDYQDKLFNNYVKELGLDYASMCSAQAGYSEHQLGLAVDIANNTLDYDNFDKTKEFNWVKDNAYKYGFILRYPIDKVDITGYKYEPWHYRYIDSIDLAKYLYDNNLTLEEYKKRYE